MKQPESLLFWKSNSDEIVSLGTTLPGVTGDFVLVKGDIQASSGVSTLSWQGQYTLKLIEIDCNALDALDKARTADLLALKKRLISISAPVDTFEPHTPVLSCSSSPVSP